HTDGARKMLKEVFADAAEVFDNPKPLGLLDRILQVGADKNAIILDSFAGSGTAAHAVLSANQQDNGNRRFILVECEDYADTVTAQRVRNAIKGVPKAKDVFLKHGLGGSFTYCTLGDALELDKLLTGEKLPSFEALGALLFHTATNQVIEPKKIDTKTGYLGATASYHVWLIYEPNLDFLKSDRAALTLDRAEKIAQLKQGSKRHLVFAPATFVSKKRLDEANFGQGVRVDYQPLPWALYRVAGS
ncbi:MAG: DNA methyltransferase, partial [Gammaproteobacteria bacterium]